MKNRNAKIRLPSRGKFRSKPIRRDRLRPDWVRIERNRARKYGTTGSSRLESTSNSRAVVFAVVVAKSRAIEEIAAVSVPITWKNRSLGPRDQVRGGLWYTPPASIDRRSARADRSFDRFDARVRGFAKLEITRIEPPRFKDASINSRWRSTSTESAADGPFLFRGNSFQTRSRGKNAPARAHTLDGFSPLARN